jgi:phosphoesterase RecJ-like protein
LLLGTTSYYQNFIRSKGDISVQEIAQKYFNGGGHKNASGGGVYASLKDIIDKVKSNARIFA